MHQVQSVSEKLMICFARGLGFENDYFIKAHDVTRPDSQSVCRLLHYFETPEIPNSNGEVFHRAGAHADWFVPPPSALSSFTLTLLGTLSHYSSKKLASLV